MVKRPASSAGSPPPAASTSTLSASTSSNAAGPKPKKPRTTKPKPPKKSKKGGGGIDTPAGSPPPVGTPGGASSPAGSPPRGRSMSVIEGDELPTKGKKGKGKAKAKENVTAAATEEQDEFIDKEQQQDEREDQDAEDDDDLDFSDDEFGSNAQEIAKQKEDLRVLLEHFDQEQMNRYEHYRRSGLNKASVRKLVNQVLGQTVSPSILTVVRGFAKVFVGEIVEKARSSNPHPGPLTPQDLRDAYRLYLEEHQGAGAGGQGGGRKKMFVK